MREYSSDDLYNEIVTISEIRCSNCKVVHTTMMPSPEDEFFSKGWRATSSNVYCPDCAKIKLKS